MSWRVEASIQSKEMKKMESALIAALKAHAGALLDMGDDNNAEIKHIFDELGKWVDTTDPLHSVLKSRVDASCERLKIIFLWIGFAVSML